MGCGLRQFRLERGHDLGVLGPDRGRIGLLEIVRTRVDTHGWAVLGTRVSRLRW
jgi:hypothetical protein